MDVERRQGCGYGDKYKHEEERDWMVIERDRIVDV